MKVISEGIGAKKHNQMLTFVFLPISTFGRNMNFHSYSSVAICL